MNMHHCLGKYQLTRSRECNLFKRADVETFLLDFMNFEYNHLTNPNITVSINWDREERESKHTSIALVTSHSTSQPFSYMTSHSPYPESNKIKLTKRDL